MIHSMQQTPQNNHNTASSLTISQLYPLQTDKSPPRSSTTLPSILTPLQAPQSFNSPTRGNLAPKTCKVSMRDITNMSSVLPKRSRKCGSIQSVQRSLSQTETMSFVPVVRYSSVIISNIYIRRATKSGFGTTKTCSTKSTT